MSDNFISSIHIQKLGHKILEIRQRALHSIISKLEHGFVYDNELARSKEILSKLFEWFLYTPCTNEELVFNLIKRTLQSEGGQTLLRHYGSTTLKKELEQIRTYVEPKFHKYIEELLKLVEDYKEVVVPPLECDIPLSYRSGQTSSDQRSKNIGTTATTIEGFVHKDRSLDHQTGQEAGYPSLATYSLPNYINESQNYKSTTSKSNKNYILSWQPLIEADRHVLKSVELSLRKPPHPSALLHSCEFFTDVLLHDFPAEVFLQRPTIVLQFQNLLISCPSTRVTNAVFNCLFNLTKALQVRVNHSRDPSMYSTKTIISSVSNSQCDSPSSYSSKKLTYNGSSSKSSAEEFDKIGDYVATRIQQMTLPRYCFSTIQFIFKYLCVKPESIRESNRRNLNQVGVNISLNLLHELLNLLNMTINSDIWNENNNTTSSEVIREITETLVQYGDSLEYFRLEASSNDSSLNYRAVQIFVLANCSCLLNSFIPLEKCKSILPQNLKSELSYHLVDFTIARLFPKVHNIILDYVKRFSEKCDKNPLKKYVEVENICNSMSATAKLLNSYKTLTSIDIIYLMKQSLISLEFHKELKLLKIFVEICANKLQLIPADETLFKTVEDITLSLLSHKEEVIKEEMYNLCHKRIIAAIGPKLNDSGIGVPGSQVLFLLQSEILIEIALFGVTSKNTVIQEYSQDILLHIIKCKILVSDNIWNKALEALIPALPIILCQCNRNFTLGRTIINVFDPDTAKELLIPSIEVLKGNIQLLFSLDSQTKNEAFSRLCWLLASQKDSRSILPRLNNLQDKALANVCQVKTVLDINKIRAAQHFYQPSSLQQVLDLLNSPNVEPVIRRSALTQISVMLEDQILHQTFIQGDGINTVINIMKVALVEDDFREYPDSIIPAISILKNLSLHTPFARQNLSNNVDIFFCVLRGLFLFFTEERLKQDASSLLFLLIFNNFCMGSPSKSSFSLPQLISDKLRMPFNCLNHWNVSHHSLDSLIPLITSDKWCLSSIQVQWNSEMLGGIHKLIEQDVLRPNYNVNELLTLKTYDLQCLKFSAIDYCIEKYLAEIQIEDSHNGFIDLINKLINYICLYSMLQEKNLIEDNNNFLTKDLEIVFKKYLKTLPSSEEDVNLLTTIINMLTILTPLYKKSDKQCWINSLLKDPCLCLLDVIHVDSTTDEETKSLSGKLLRLITICVCQEQHYLDLYPQSYLECEEKQDLSSWYNVIEIISNSLKFSDTQHFYNLAYLDSLLSCLVHLTATLSWSGSKSGSPPKQQLKQLVSGLCELVGAFHCGKGTTAAVSVMGLGITRHVLLILNHLLAEMQSSNVKNWEFCFIELKNGYSLKSFITLLSSRDVILRAAAMQLFAGLTVSPRASIEIVHEIFNEKQSIWEVTLSIVIDHEEASIVRENAAIVLANLASHTTVSPNDNKLVIISGVAPAKHNKNLSSTGLLLSLLDDYQFFKNLELILTSLYTIKLISQDSTIGNTLTYSTVNEKQSDKFLCNSSDKSWSSSSNSNDLSSITTPGFIKSVTVFLLNVLALAEEEISTGLQDMGLVKLLFRCLCNPSISINNTKQLSLYCELLEMNAAICSFLSQAVTSNSSCLGTILHTRDCLNVFLSLLNPQIYHIHLPQLIYLRNKLWTEIFCLIGALLESGNENQGKLSHRSIEALNILSNTLMESGQQPFLEALCEAIGSIGSNDLQTSALCSLTSLLKVETSRFSDTDSDQSTTCSMQSLLDTVTTPRNTYVEDYSKENEENIEPYKNTNKYTDKYKMNVLENIYFEPVLKTKTDKFSLKQSIPFPKKSQNDNEKLMAGAELCKILLHLYDLSNLKIPNEIFNTKKKSIIVATLTSILCVSHEAKNYALRHNLLEMIIKQLKDCHIKLSMESVECLRRVGDKRRVHPVIKEINEICGLLTNFMIGSENVKKESALLGIADLIHKLWVWFQIQKSYLIDVLRMLCTYTTDCPIACHSMPFTSSVAGTGPRKVPNNISLLHAIITLIGKEMEQVSKTHDLLPLQLSLQILHNCCNILECRVLLTKSNFLQSITRLHPALTKRQKPWDNVEQLWLEFLESFTLHPEGQTSVAKVNDILELILTLTLSTKISNRFTALLVIRNLSFYQSNRPKLLSSGEFLNILRMKLTNGTVDEKDVVISIVWALVANNQKAKLVLKNAQIDLKIQDALKQYHLLNGTINNESIEKMNYVLSLLKDNEKNR